MRRTDETPRRRGQVDGDNKRGDTAPTRHGKRSAQTKLPNPDPSKTRRKAEMHALQDLGEALVALSPARLARLSLPERLADAVVEARSITKWEARRRQMQFIGRLMRNVDAEPIRAHLAQWEGAT